LNCKYICVSGYGWSGSGLYVDFLNAMPGITSLGFEFSLLKERHGLLDLDYAIVENWDVLRTSYAIRDFKTYCGILDRAPNRLGKWGLGLSRKLNVDVNAITDQFIDTISEYSYRGNSRVNEYHLTHVQSFIKKLKRRIYPREHDFTEMIFTRPLENQEFTVAVRTYLDKLLDKSFDGGQADCLILDQAVPSTNPQRALDYLTSAKLVIIDRDPRDIFVDLVNARRLVGAEKPGRERALKYIAWHKGLREKRPVNGDKILNLKFEDLVLRRDEVVPQLSDFLGVDRESFHKNPYDVTQSRKNIGLWRSFPFEDEIRLIEDHLPV
jgi:hypothetical protein